MNDHEIIYAYTRAHAIADGVLIDVTDAAKDSGLRYPTALTSAAWIEVVEIPPTDLIHKVVERLDTVLTGLCEAIRQSTSTRRTTLLFAVEVCDEDNIAKCVTLKAICGPGDDERPVLTIMLPDED